MISNVGRKAIVVYPHDLWTARTGDGWRVGNSAPKLIWQFVIERRLDHRAMSVATVRG